MLKYLFLFLCLANVPAAANNAAIWGNLAVQKQNNAETEAVVSSGKRLIDDYSDPLYIEFFENKIIKRKIVSNIPESKLAEMAERYGVSPENLKTLLCLQYALDSIGKTYTVSNLAEMTDGELLGHALSFYAVFWPELSNEEKQDIKTEFEKVNETIKKRR